MQEVIIKASKSQLERIGINRDLTGVKGEHLRHHATGYATIIVSAPSKIVEFLGSAACPEEYDIPRTWLEYL